MTPENDAATVNDKMSEARVRQYLDALAKPPGSLGRLEDLAVRLSVTAGTLSPVTSPRSLVVFAADHGATASGVSLWPQTVSGVVAQTLLAGKAAASVMAKAAGANVRLVDVGLACGQLRAHPRLFRARVLAGTRNLAEEDALTQEEFERALEIGAEAAAQEIATGAKVLIAGEIGIGNTTSAAALIALLCDATVEDVLGNGAGATAESLVAKANAIGRGLERARGHRDRTVQIASVAGLEIAAMAGFYVEAAARGTPVVLDGAMAAAAALIAQELAPACVGRMIAAHLSSEPAHRIALERLGLSPFLDWGMRLGEGTGALAVLPLLDAAAAILSDMASLDEAMALANG